MKPAPGFAKSIRGHEDFPGGKGPEYLVVADGGQAHGSQATTLLAVGGSSELTGCDRRGEVGGEGFRCPRKDALVRTVGRGGHFVDEGVGHIEQTILLSQLSQFSDYRRSLRRG